MITEKQKIEGNTAIALFDGWDLHPEKSDLIWKSESTMRLISSCDYHDSWDWLMPVVEKIESLRFTSLVIADKRCSILNIDTGFLADIKDEADTKIEAVWLAVVAFCKWYNEQKSSR